MKKGFGLMEVMAAAVVLGFLAVGLMQLQKGNREAVLRIRARDAAQIVAQEFIDSLSSIGIYSIEAGTVYNNMTKEYEWQGKPNQKTANGITSSVTYTIEDVTIEDMISKEHSELVGTVEYIRAKKIDFKVSWPFKNSTQSISLSRIIK
ncbi:MAG: type II secretion system GspH family protein [Fibromonadaceae bacterium]|jgi:prepilin-type N-terminal cleavage/methylation domain-containing protein|nr:type II secretion system GspH family protein [Fibromonadaceae bacterium]